MRRVPISAVPLDPLAPVLGAQRFADLTEVAAGAGRALAGRSVLNVNSTAVGGGVAEMLISLLAYARGTGIDARWAVIDAPPEFFVVTKRIHNHIYGHPGDGGDLGPKEQALYEGVLAEQAEELLALTRPRDVVLLHDPQTVGLAGVLRKAGARVVWRCHIGVDRQNSHAENGWRFLAPYLEDVDVVVVSSAAFAPPGFPADRVQVIPPSIDPLAVKNVPLAPEESIRILAYAGLLQGQVKDPPVFHRRDGSPARLNRRADIVQLGPPPPVEAPLVVQVSRWDRLKDMEGVLTGYAEQVDGARGAHLVLAGPNVTGVADDPEGAAVYEECVTAWRRLPHAQRQHIHLACLPTADAEENAVLVNALQRHASVVVQKSLAEGFGLTVSEAMWKERPVVASAVGGISDQITDDSCGILLADPTDLTSFARAVGQLLDDPELAGKIGRAAHERAAEFLPDRHLTRWGQLLTSLTTGV